MEKLTKERIRSATEDFLYLVGCGVDGRQPEKAKARAMDFEAVHALSKRSSLEALTCMALEDAFCGKLPEEPIFKTWTGEKNQAIYKTLLFDGERAQVLAFLEGAGIWYLPLKGILLKDLYPKLGMRQMADNDILFDGACRSQVQEWFLGRGYELEEEIVTNHDAYQKRPVYNFEMHFSLFNSAHGDVVDRYYQNVKERLLPQEGTKFGYRFRDEDFYIYITIHGYEHYVKGGTGLRTLLDSYVFTQAKSLDFSYVEGELDKLGAGTYEAKVRSLGRKLFAQPQSLSLESLTPEEESLLEEFLFSGTYGNLKTKTRNQVRAMSRGTSSRRAKFSYIWRRMFPDLEFFKNYYPFFYRHKWLLPVGYVYRLLFRSFVQRKKIRQETTALRDSQ